MARLLGRTIDMLRQIVFVDNLLPHLREAAADALKGMERGPMAEIRL